MQAIVKPRLEELKRDYHDEQEVLEFIDDLGADMVEQIADFRAPEDGQQPVIPGLPAMPRDGIFERYKVNVIVTHAQDATAPVIVEENPSYYHMFGRIDYRSSFGSVVTDHTMIKPGALHRANGGFLVVQALDVLSAPFVWETLKRALRTRQLRLENMGEQLSIIPTASLAPEPIPLNVKVAMIGTSRVFQILQTVDEDFQKLFKAKADFTIDVDRGDEQVRTYARFIAKQVADLGMRPFDRSARGAHRRAKLAHGRRPGEALAPDDGHRRPARRGGLLGVRRTRRRRGGAARRQGRSIRRCTARTCSKTASRSSSPTAPSRSMCRAPSSARSTGSPSTTWATTRSAGRRGSPRASAWAAAR